MLMNDSEITEASTADLVRAGLGVLRGTKGKNYVGTKKVTWSVVPYTETLPDGTVVSLFPLTAEMAEAGEGVAIFSLIDPEFSAHTPKSVTAVVDGVEVEVEVEGDEAE
jgi:hypothetical protein